MAMLSLRQDFPDIADEIIVAARSHAALNDALVDYKKVCVHAGDQSIPAENRVHWTEIRAELVTEIRRIFLRLGKK